MNWLAVENATTWLPGFPAAHLPSVLHKSIRLVYRNGNVGLEVAGVVGAVKLGNGDTLHITPKIGSINFLRMLFVCEGIQKQLQPELSDLTADYALQEEHNVSKLIAVKFLQEIHRLRTLSLRFERQSKKEQDSFVRGRLRIVPSLLNLKRGVANAAVFDILTRNYDTAENRLLAAAAQQALSYVPQDSADPLIQTARHWIKQFARPKSLARDIITVNGKLQQDKIGGPRGYYGKPLALAKILLGQAGLATGARADVTGEAVLINTAALFEEYVRTVLAERYAGRGLIVRKDAQQTLPLYADGSFRLLPDICIYASKGLLLLADAKYKVPDAKDHYQLQAYMKAYEATTGVFFTPAYGEDSFLIRQYTPVAGGKVYEVRLSLSDLEATENFLGRILQELGVLGGS